LTLIGEYNSPKYLILFKHNSLFGDAEVNIRFFIKLLSVNQNNLFLLLIHSSTPQCASSNQIVIFLISYLIIYSYILSADCVQAIINFLFGNLIKLPKLALLEKL
jgi:hypothetical protein